MNKIEQKLNDMGVSMKIEFVPLSKSRNAKKEYSRATDYTLNWKVTIFKDGKIIFKDVDYMQGVGHLPRGLGNSGYCAPGFSLIQDKFVKQACETGKYVYNWKKDSNTNILKDIDIPRIADIIYSLLIDGDAWDYDSFEDWAQSFGYDEDSIKAKKMFDDCMATAVAFHKNFSDQELEDLYDLFVDY
jgi:hypothetical protein